jgi:hypothetical protein
VAVTPGKQGCPLGDDSCPFSTATGRHRHAATQLDALGERCFCGANKWVLRFGGPLPAMVCCHLCGQGFNIGQRLRDCGKPLTHRVAGKVSRT